MLHTFFLVWLSRSPVGIPPEKHTCWTLLCEPPLFYINSHSQQILSISHRTHKIFLLHSLKSWEIKVNCQLFLLLHFTGQALGLFHKMPFCLFIHLPWSLLIESRHSKANLGSLCISILSTAHNNFIYVALFYFQYLLPDTSHI